MACGRQQPEAWTAQGEEPTRVQSEGKEIAAQSSANGRVTFCHRLPGEVLPSFHPELSAGACRGQCPRGPTIFPLEFRA